jgi:predicted metal-binding transcription factor (methanogenesis marker protein 9)
MTFQETTNEDKQRVENGNNKSSDELLELKKELADEIVDKILEKDSNLFSVLFK